MQMLPEEFQLSLFLSVLNDEMQGENSDNQDPETSIPEIPYAESSAVLTMNGENDKVTIGGNLYVQTTEKNQLTNGEIAAKGNITVLETSNQNRFSTSQNCELTMAGEGNQDIHSPYDFSVARFKLDSKGTVSAD